jgi:predicted dehydrogenase
MRLGILSTARINERILSAASQTPRIRVVAVASRDPYRAEAYARSHNIPGSYGRYDELLSDPDVDAVYISLPNSLHVDWAVRALEAGKHVLCEKPLAQDGQGAREAFESARRSGRALLEGFMYQYHPQTVRLLELLDERAIGELRLVRSCFRSTVASTTDIRLNRSLGGGSLMDLGCYCVHAIRLLAGEPERVYAQKVEGADGVEVSFQALLRLGRGVVALMDSSLSAPLRQELEIVGDTGSLHVAAPFRVDLGSAGIELVRFGKSELVKVAIADSYALELEYFADLVEGKRTPDRMANSVEQAAVLGALYESAALGLPIDM